MIRFEPVAMAADDWRCAIQPFGPLSLPQSWEYGAARAVGGWQVERGLFRDADETVGAVQVMTRPLPLAGGGLAWVSRGPLHRPGNAADLPAMLAALRTRYAGSRGWYLRAALPVAAGDAALAGLASAGFRVTATPGWASAVLDLGKPVDALRAALRQKWRNALNKAERSGTRVIRADDAGFDGFLAEYETFVARRGFVTTVTADVLRRLQQLLPHGRKMACYRALHEGTVLGSALIVRYGTTAEYLAGTLTHAGRQVNAGQLMLWQAITDAKTDGAAWFDVGGMDPALTPAGIYHFKSGMGGTPYRLANEVEATGGDMRARLVRWGVERARRAA